jgi:ubiquinone biosynthesis protein UbiJ
VLESFLPPGVSAPLGAAAARVQAGWRETLARAETGLRDYAVNESGLVGRTEMQRFLRDVDELREAIDRLDARLQQLTARTA